MAESYDAANLEAMSVARAYQAAMLRLVRDKLELGRAIHVADFGAGRGDYAAGLANATGVSILSYEPDETLHVHYPAPMEVVSSLDALSDGCLDAAYSLNVLEHIPDDVAALRAWAAKCKAGASIFLLVPANPALWTPMDTLVGHQRRYMPGTLRQVVQAAGLEVESAGWFDRTGYFATRIFGALSRIRPAKQGAGSVSKGQVRVFDAMFACAEPLFERLNLAFGKNCWVLAKKPA